MGGSAWAAAGAALLWRGLDETPVEEAQVAQRGTIYVEPVRVTRDRRAPRRPDRDGAEGALAAGARARAALFQRRRRARQPHAAGRGHRSPQAVGPAGLRSYTPEYLTGFQSEAYQAALGAGFEEAKE
jgi:hypothetical protein